MYDFSNRILFRSQHEPQPQGRHVPEHRLKRRKLGLVQPRDIQPGRSVFVYMMFYVLYDFIFRHAYIVTRYRRIRSDLFVGSFPDVRTVLFVGSRRYEKPRKPELVCRGCARNAAFSDTFTRSWFVYRHLSTESVFYSTTQTHYTHSHLT